MQSDNHLILQNDSLSPRCERSFEPSKGEALVTNKAMKREKQRDINSYRLLSK